MEIFIMMRIWSLGKWHVAVPVHTPTYNIWNGKIHVYVEEGHLHLGFLVMVGTAFSIQTASSSTHLAFKEHKHQM